MYSSNREKQIKFTKSKLKSDGIIGFIEKFSNTDANEFFKREQIKDIYFKRRFFSEEDIFLKKKNVLSDMNNGLVTLEQFIDALSKFFAYAVINWNSGNFYTLYASNNKNNLLNFLSYMPSSLIPDKYVHIELPTALLTLNKSEIKYRTIKEN
ncbi:hypothetical protein ACFSN5_01690 [Streptococcus tangpeifui]|uniref:hypothetical protein n=1 Tax=Streptococcus tangpeifui TaxID=2709400 RepID=UPI0013EB0A01|nr:MULTISPECIES: hypothetical protein [unclassified Streptococcus]